MNSCRSRWLTAVCILFSGACSHPSTSTRVLVLGGDAGGMPRALPAEEHLDAAMLAKAATDPVAAGAQVFVVARHGHIVFEHYDHGVDPDTLEAPDGFAPVLSALASGIAVHDDLFPLPARTDFDAAKLRQSIESGAHQGYADYLSVHLWRRLNAGPAWIDSAPGSPVPADCCFHARVLDWLRVGDLLVEDGQFEGKQVAPPGWVARMRQPVTADGTHGFGVLLPPAAHGSEAFDVPDVFFLRAAGHWRLWLAPSLRLAVLFGASDEASGDDASWDEIRLLNLVTRALSDPASVNEGASRLKGLVPGH
jgi:hypothetical protein